MAQATIVLSDVEGGLVVDITFEPGLVNDSTAQRVAFEAMQFINKALRGKHDLTEAQMGTSEVH